MSLLGPGTNAADVPPLVTGTRNIVAAMHEHGVRRLVATGTPSISDEADSKDWKIGLLVKLISRFQPVAYDAIVTIGRIVRESGLDWTIVRLPFLSNGPRTTRIKRAKSAKRAACGYRAPTPPHSCWNRRPTRPTCTRRPSSPTNDYRFRQALPEHRIAAGRVH